MRYRPGVRLCRCANRRWLTVDEVNDGAEIMTAILKEKRPSVGSLERPRAVPPGRGLPQSAQLGVPSLRSTPTRDCGIGFVTR